MIPLTVDSEPKLLSDLSLAEFPVLPHRLMFGPPTYVDYHAALDSSPYVCATYDL